MALSLVASKDRNMSMEACVKLVEVGEKEGSRRPLGHCWLSKGFEFFAVGSFGRY